MGAGASKQAGKAAAATSRRQYPSSSSILNNAPSTSHTPSHSSSQVRPNPRDVPPADSKDPHIDLDGRDPHFGASLRRLGPAVPVERAAPEKSAFPTSSQPPLGQQGRNIFPSAGGARNAGMMIVDARKAIQERWDRESEGLGRKGFEGRTLINAKDLKEAMKMVEGGVPVAEVERQMRLRSGILQKLSRPGLYTNV